MDLITPPVQVIPAERTNEQIFGSLSKGHQTINNVQQQRTRNLSLLTNLSRTTAPQVQLLIQIYFIFPVLLF